MSRRFWSWLWLLVGALYFFVPLAATLQFSLQLNRGAPTWSAYGNVLTSPKFVDSFVFSLQTALATIAVSILLIVPTAYWVHLRLPHLRPLIEFCTLLPFVVPAVVLVFGLIRAYNRTPLTDSHQGLRVLLIGSYVILSFPYMFRSVDSGLRAIDVRVLTEAAQSLGAGWLTVLGRVIAPNILIAVLGGAFITFAIVMGEFTIAFLLAQPAFGPYMNQISSSKVYEPSALAIISFVLTWASIAAIQLVGTRFSPQGRR
jgi:putative spermidine/putrescine transport system permease protein